MQLGVCWSISWDLVYSLSSPALVLARTRSMGVPPNFAQNKTTQRRTYIQALPHFCCTVKHPLETALTIPAPRLQSTLNSHVQQAVGTSRNSTSSLELLEGFPSPVRASLSAMCIHEPHVSSLGAKGGSSRVEVPSLWAGDSLREASCIH
jgi:hypothetical protein